MSPGIAGPDDVLKATRAELDAAFSTNVSGPMVITQTFLPLLKAAPQPKVRPIAASQPKVRPRAVPQPKARPRAAPLRRGCRRQPNVRWAYSQVTR